MNHKTNGLPFQTRKKSSNVSGGSVTIHREILTATTEGQTVFNLSNVYTPYENRIRVVINGVPQYSPSNFSETDQNTITLSEGVPIDTEVVVEIIS